MECTAEETVIVRTHWIINFPAPGDTGTGPLVLVTAARTLTNVSSLY